MKTIVDTDALLGLFNEKDVHAEKSLHFLSFLAKEQSRIFLLTTTLAEFALLATSRIGLKETKEAVVKLQNPPYHIIETTEEITSEALLLYKKQTSKEESLFDCYVMTAAKKIKADAIFSFDKGYQKNGFKLVSDIV